MSGGGSRTDWSKTGRPAASGSGGGDGGDGVGGLDPCDIISLTNLNSPAPVYLCAGHREHHNGAPADWAIELELVPPSKIVAS
jgi:hypothetical protein